MSPTPSRSAPPRSAPRPRVLSGMRPTGRLHLGNYMGALYNWVHLQQDYDCFFFIADLHALTTDYADPSRLKQNIFDIAIDFLAAGLNPGKCTMFIQSHVPQHAELHLLFSMFTPLGWLERVPSYKDQQQQLASKDLGTYGFLGYPLLQAADILLYRPQLVPVGADQVAHVELTREVARKFNALYSPKRVVSAPTSLEGTLNIQTEPDAERLVLNEPEVLLTPSPKLPGIDGRKMSKSYGNAIYLTDQMDVVQRKMHSMTNGGQRPTQADPGNPEICPVGDLHRVFSRPEMDHQIRLGCSSATLRCDECKFMAATSIFAVLQPIQIRRRELEDKAETVWQVLQNGAQRAQEAAEAVMHDVRAVTGLSRDLSAIHIPKHLAPQQREEDARNLSSYKDAWEGLLPAELARNVRAVWRSRILPPEIAIKPDTPALGELWLTPNGRRVCVVVARQNSAGGDFIFVVKPKTYEVLVLLCLDSDFHLRDFVIPQKRYLAEWNAAKKLAGKSGVNVKLSSDKAGEVCLYFQASPLSESSQPVRIEDTETNYAIF